MTVRLVSLVHSESLHRLFVAGGGVCCICGEDINPNLAAPHGHALTADHVIARRPRDMSKARLAHLRRLLAFPSVSGSVQSYKAPAHKRCNGAKGNRPPTGCEILMLMAVNARLYDKKRKLRTLRPGFRVLHRHGFATGKPLAPTAQTA